MPKKSKDYNIVKVPLKSININGNKQIFPRVPRLYLELIENKDKIHQDFVGKEWVPRKIPEEMYIDNFYRQGDNDHNNDAYESTDISDISDTDDFSESDADSDVNRDKNDDMSDDSSDISSRLKDLLDDKRDDEYFSQSSVSDKYSQRRDKHGTPIDREPPTLSELKESGGYVPQQEFVNLDQYNNNETVIQDEDEQKREILFKFDLLRKSYPASFIPEYNIHTDLTILKRSYQDNVRRLSLDSSVENYKTYLIYGFMACEFLFGNYFGFDMKGFTQQQITSMSSYEKLLIELGEKNYVPEGSKWPVELRLVFLILMNTAFFIVSRSIMKKTGSNIMGMMNKMSENVKTKPKRSMKGPTVNLDDI